MRKARVTTMLSLTGVLVAGSAAALVNTQVLGNPTPRTRTASEITAVLSTPEVSDPVTVSGPSTSEAEETEETVTTVTDSTVGSATSYEVGDAGVVTVDTTGGVLRIVSATPSAGWTVAETRQVDDLHVKVVLRSLATTVEFEANLLFDKITTSVEASSNVDGSVTTSNTTPNTTPSSGTQAGGNGGGTSTPVTTATTPRTTSPSTSSAPSTTDDKGGGKGGGKGGDDHTDD